ncbi:glycoside hydrolase family 3 C-terminal domain-containing protein [Microbacterium sp. AGC85]
MHPLVSHLSLREKAEFVSGATFWTTRAIEKHDVESATLTDGPHGVRHQRAGADHLGINDSEPATSFPTAASTGSSWDPLLLERMGLALGVESRQLGVDVLLGPGVNIKRSPLCGRNFEYFSEDPLLSGSLGAAWVRGVQSQGVGASVKHFAANNQETNRMRINAAVDERTLREIYLPAFEHVVRDSRPATVMCSYNKINGTYASQNRWLLTDVLRDEWGFEGYVVSDWGAVVDPVAAVAAGLDLEMPSSGDRGPSLIEAAVSAGELDEALLDQAVSRLLTVHDRLRDDRTEVTADLEAHHQLARELAAAGSVLLANEGDLLPLDPAQGGDIAVMGEFARTPRYQGAGSSHIVPTRLDDALAAITAATTREVRFAPGFTIEDGDDAALRAEATEIARTSEIVLLFLGLPDEAESEGFDRTDLFLPRNQRELFDAVYAVNPNVVVVLSNGSVVSLEGIRGKAPAILEMWLAGQAGGTAAADIVFGAAEPGGRLAETIPVSLAHTPAYVNWPGSNGTVRYGEGVAVGYRWYDITEREVAYPFGFGLGYTTFAYTDLRVIAADPATAHAIVEVTVENTGSRAGSDVVQVYVGEDRPSVTRAPRELRAFKKVHLAPGERETLTFELDDRAFAWWGASGWTVTPGSYAVSVGRHSRDLSLEQSIVLFTPEPVVALAPDSTIGEWMSHPRGSAVVSELFESMAGTGGLPTDSDTLKLIEDMPLRTMIGFGASATDGEEAVRQLLAQVAE